MKQRSQKPEGSTSRVGEFEAEHDSGLHSARRNMWSRWNARKHGILSEEIVISAGRLAEDGSEFESILESLQTDLQPEGTLEEMLVEKIAVAYWRLRRVLRSETGRVGMQHASVFTLPNMENGSMIPEGVAFFEKASPMSRTKDRIIARIEMLQKTRAKVEKLGYIPEELYQPLLKECEEEGHLGWKLATLKRMGTLMMEAPAPGNERESDEFRSRIIPQFDKEIAIQTMCKDSIDRVGNALFDATKKRLCIPSGEDMDRYLRYETMLERQLYRAMDQLERMQRHRRGETVPAPLKIQVSGHE